MSTVICQGCGQAFAVPPGYSRNKIQCPGCGVICQVPAGDVDRSEEPLPQEPETAPEPTFPRQDAAGVPVVAVPPLSLELDEPAFVPREQEEDDEEPDPYDMVDKDKPRCPKCRKDME